MAHPSSPFRGWITLRYRLGHEEINRRLKENNDKTNSDSGSNSKHCLELQRRKAAAKLLQDAYVQNYCA